MKARIAPNRLSHAEAVKITQTALEITAPAVTAAILWTLYKKRGWHKDKVLSLYKEIVGTFAYPMAFNKWADDIEIKQYLSEKIGIDWQELVDAVKVNRERGLSQ